MNFLRTRSNDLLSDSGINLFIRKNGVVECFIYDLKVINI